MATLEELVDFVNSCADAANDPVYGKEALTTKPSDSKEKRQEGWKRSSFSTNVSGMGGEQTIDDGAGSLSNKEFCLSCKKNGHDLDDCRLFLKKPIEERKLMLRENRLCFGCYGNDHLVKGCQNRKRCKTCGKRHPTALHIPGFKLPGKSNNQECKTDDLEESNRKVNNGSTGVQTSQPTIFHAILPVKVRHKNSDKLVDTYAFYDNGSDGCFITNTLKDQLEVSGTEITLKLGTMHGQSHVPSTIVNDLIVTDTCHQNPIEISKLYSREFIPVDHRQIPTPETLSKCKHLAEICKEIPSYNPNLEIGLLIGSNCPIALEPLRVIPCNREGPFAIHLRHGWTINGPIQISDETPHNTTVNRITIRQVERVKEILTPKSLLRTLEMDFNDHAELNGKAYSQEDKSFLKRAEQDIQLIDGHYQLPLPFRNSDPRLPNNRQQATQRAYWQKKKMLSNEKYRHDYVTFVENLITKGYAEKILTEQNSPTSGKIWYLPHHGLYHAKKPDKIRVVFDCSARYGNTSLNDQLLQGPDLTNTLIGVLTRFRQEPFAFTADIESMFYQVNVPINQRDFLRFVWWPNGDLSQPIEEYRMTVHIFGAVSSPSCSNFALRQTGADNVEEFGSAVAQTIHNNFYVDDCLKSVDEQYAACELTVKLREACAKGGFRLTKFTSNNRALLASIPEEERAKEVKCLDLTHDTLPIQRTLGVLWCIESDQFQFRITLSTKPLTRRGVLSVVSSVYDPFGFVAPFVLSAKKILQDLCRENKLDWDDEIPEQYRIRWMKWIKELPEIEKLSVDRCLKPTNFG
ncbi:uncharacterized protein LOC114518689 [Dendronephthya gigantea]|uniref:uncharacterized protein LOC114518689 n=1 Tax=Dendronephthya gigantea TaxID=151771 RepID=UPI00106AB74B|nr:uncharacterized protein LOC114518689 [Dendronephthya gigantea]